MKRNGQSRLGRGREGQGGDDEGTETERGRESRKVVEWRKVSNFKAVILSRWSYNFMRRVARCQFVVCLGRGERGREGEKWGLISVCDMCKIWLGKEKRSSSRAEHSIAEDSGCGGLSEDRRAPRRQLFDSLVMYG